MAFELLPTTAPAFSDSTESIRPSENREAAPGRTGWGWFKKNRDREPHPIPDLHPEVLRVLTYNVHSCFGTDGKLAPERIARLIAQYEPHIVALQEVDVGRRRTGGQDQARQIAKWLRMAYYFHPSIHMEEEQYGNVILTPLPMRLVKTGALPGSGERQRREPRGILWAAVEFRGKQIHIINTHLGLKAGERQQQVDCLLSKDWLDHPDNASPMIVCGDFNALPRSRVMRRMRSRLQDVQHKIDGHRPKATFHSRFPMARIDHILIDDGMVVDALHIPRSSLARIASDHLPLVADLRISG